MIKSVFRRMEIRNLTYAPVRKKAINTNYMYFFLKIQPGNGRQPEIH